uniref:Uncharacterized protein n=1 Tax=Chenopodium quinoa TaxID=63459 RepID=A0A803N1W5_CHEQI
MNKQLHHSPPIINSPPQPQSLQTQPWFPQQVAWPNYPPHNLIPPPPNPQLIHLLSGNIEKDLENPDHHMKIFLIKREEVGFQLEVNFWETVNTIRELNAMMIPLKIHDVVLMDGNYAWRDWDKFDPLCSMEDPIPSFPDLNMKIVMWNVRGATRNEFIPPAWDVIMTHKPSVFILLETKSDGCRAAEVSKLLGFDHSKFINPNGLRADAACLVDLGFSGNPFTWHNAREGDDLIRERLDRALGNPSWLNTYPNSQ